MKTISNYSKLKIGDKLIEFGYGLSIKSTITTEPKLEWGAWIWQSEREDWKVVDYLVNLSHMAYAPDIYLQ